VANLDARPLVGALVTELSDNVVDHNLYYAPGGGDAGSWQWKGTTYHSFSDYVHASGNDAGSMFADPMLSDPAKGNFLPSSGSPARS
jgi:hypothetical protein